MTNQEKIKQLRTQISELITETSSPEATVKKCADMLLSRIEILRVFYLNIKNEIIKTHDFQGTINQCLIPVREIARESLIVDANSVIIVHNHPSGKTQPSQNDKFFTDAIKNALKLFEIKLIDSIIIGTDEDYFSLAEKGIL